jgi:hypothetical protein
MTLFHKWLIAAVVCFLSIVQIGSAHADKYHINGLYIALVVVSFGFFAYFGYKGFSNNKPE